MRLYDTRSNNLILKNESDFEDQISGICVKNDVIILSSLDGSLGSFDFRVFTNDAYLKYDTWKPRKKSEYNQTSFNDLLLHNDVL